jgi:outer membrane protein TolC
MLAEFVGLLAIILAVWSWLTEPHRGIRSLTLAALSAVIAQGILGGVTVLFLLPPLISGAHAALGQTFFSMTVVIALLSRRNNFVERQRPEFDHADRNLTVLSAISVGLLYVQLILGAMFRHGGMDFASRSAVSVDKAKDLRHPLRSARSMSDHYGTQIVEVRTDPTCAKSFGRLLISPKAFSSAIVAIVAIAFFSPPCVGQAAEARKSQFFTQQEVGEHSAASNAPETDPNAISLTMREAVKLALKENPRLLAARLDALESRQTAKISRSEFLPKATLVLEEQRNRLNLATLIGQENSPYSVGPYSNLQLGSSFDVPVITISAWRSYQAEKRRANASELQASNLQEATASLVVGQYLSLVRSEATEAAVQSRLDLAESLLRLANDEVTQGTGTSTDALRADVEVHIEKENLVNAQAQTRAFSFGLVQVLGLKESRGVIASDRLTSDDTQTPDDLQALAEAFKNRPDLLSAETLRRAAKYDHDAAVAQSLPEFHFDGFWAQSGRNPAGALPIYTYQAEMRLPLFTGGRRTAETHRTELAEQRAEDLVTDRRDTITQEVRTALSSLDAARQELQLATEALKLSVREVTESRNRFAAGVTNNIEVITAQNSLAQATDSQIGAMYALQQAKADLSRARGRMVEDYGN